MVKAEVNGTLTYVIWMGCWTSMSLNSTWMEQWSWLSYCSWAVNSIKSYYCTKLIFTELGLSCDVKLTLRKHLQYVKLTLWSLEDLYTDWDRRMIVNGFDCWGSRGSRVCLPMSSIFTNVCLLLTSRMSRKWYKCIFFSVNKELMFCWPTVLLSRKAVCFYVRYVIFGWWYNWCFILKIFRILLFL